MYSPTIKLDNDFVISDMEDALRDETSSSSGQTIIAVKESNRFQETETAIAETISPSAQTSAIRPAANSPVPSKRRAGSNEPAARGETRIRRMDKRSHRRKRLFTTALTVPGMAMQTHRLHAQHLHQPTRSIHAVATEIPYRYRLVGEIVPHVANPAFK